MSSSTQEPPQPEQHTTLSDWQHEQVHQHPEHQPGEQEGGVENLGQPPHEDDRGVDAQIESHPTFDFHPPLPSSSQIPAWDSSASSAFDSALNAMTEHSRLLADFAMSAQGPSRGVGVGYYDPDDPMQQAFSHQHNDGEHMEESERQAQVIRAMEQHMMPAGDGDMSVEDVGTSRRGVGGRGRGRSSVGGVKTPRKRKSDPTGSTPTLTPEQKKLNHIISEQRRRASIRRGYELLCEEVPALRMAPLLNGAMRGGSGPGGGGAVGGRKRDRDLLLGVKTGGRLKKARLSDGGSRSGSHIEQDSSSMHRINTRGSEGTQGDSNAMEAILLAQHAEQADLDREVSTGLERMSAGAEAIPSPDLIGSDGRSGPRSETNVLQKTIEYLRSLHSARLSQLARLRHLRTVALSRFPPSEHEALRLHPQLVETTVVREPKLPSLSQFMKQYEAKVAVGQFLGKGGKKGKSKGEEVAERNALSVLDTEMDADTEGANDIDPNVTDEVNGEVRTSAEPPSSDNPLELNPPAESSVPADVKRPEPVRHTVVVNWEGTWNGGQVIDDEEEAENAANAQA